VNRKREREREREREGESSDNHDEPDQPDDDFTLETMFDCLRSFFATCVDATHGESYPNLFAKPEHKTRNVHFNLVLI
jgi:hypothetical protein